MCSPTIVRHLSHRLCSRSGAGRERRRRTLVLLVAALVPCSDCNCRRTRVSGSHEALPMRNSASIICEVELTPGRPGQGLPTVMLRPDIGDLVRGRTLRRKTKQPPSYCIYRPPCYPRAPDIITRAAKFGRSAIEKEIFAGASLGWSKQSVGPFVEPT